MSYYDDFVEPNAFFRPYVKGKRKNRPLRRCPTCHKACNGDLGLKRHEEAKHGGERNEHS